MKKLSKILCNRFLFDLYDFNELNSITKEEIIFMFISGMTATFKIY